MQTDRHHVSFYINAPSYGGWGIKSAEISQYGIIRKTVYSTVYTNVCQTGCFGDVDHNRPAATTPSLALAIGRSESPGLLFGTVSLLNSANLIVLDSSAER